MKKLFTLSLFFIALTVCGQKSVYVPYEWRNRTDTLIYKESDPDNKYTWSKSRSKENDNFIVFWDKGWGNTAPNELAKSNFYYVDIDDLLKQADYLYDLYINRLKFCDEANSNVGKYKMMICLNHTTEWLATGSGYDDVIGALWVNPSTCKPVGHTIGHEIGHSFQYQVYCDLKGYTGFRSSIGNGSTFWEQTAQWQAAQAFPEPRWTESWLVYGNPYFPKTANYAMTHEWMRYQSYWWHYYLAEKYGEDFIGRLWRHDPKKGNCDPNEVLMSLLDIDVKELYRLYFDYAMKMATVDIEGLKDEGLYYVTNYPYVYNYVPLGGTRHKVAYSSTPQSTGFNVIPLRVPEAGTEVTTEFTSPKYRVSIEKTDPLTYINGDAQSVSVGSRAYYNENSAYNRQRGFRLGYVALLKDGTRQYLYEDSLYCANDNSMGDKTARVSATVPEGTERLWLVVTPAPREYVQHKWDENITNDDQWPYIVEFENTNIADAPIIDERLPITDATITYNVNMPRRTDYNTMPVTLTAEAKAALGTAFQMPAAEVASHLTAWSSAEPADGKMKFYAVSQSTGNITNQSSNTNATYGHWFSAAGERIAYGTSSYLYSDFTPATLTFDIGQYPSRLTVGKTYTIAQALKYKRGTETALVKVVFNITCTAAGTAASYELASVEQSPVIDDVLTGIEALPTHSGTATPVLYYTLSGTPVAHPTRGIYIVRYADGTTKKVRL